VYGVALKVVRFVGVDTTADDRRHEPAGGALVLMRFLGDEIDDLLRVPARAATAAAWDTPLTRLLDELEQPYRGHGSHP
jgi:hypothetical protein